jgi:ankyrin repeat protein
MLEAKDTSGWTPLMVACAKGMCDAAQLLIDQGVGVSARARTFAYY